MPTVPMLSPINIDDRAIRLAPYNVAPIEFHNYWNVTGYASVVNNGHTVAVHIPKRSKLPSIKGGPLKNHYVFDSLHFHWGPDNKNGSEHHVNGTKFSMEAHIVHHSNQFQTLKEATGHKRGIAVVAMFLQASAPNPNPDLDPLIEALPKIKTAKEDTHLSAQAAFEWFRSQAQPSGYYTYIGSLLNPAAGKEVVWIVYPGAVPVSASQVEAFRNLHNIEKKLITNNCQGLCPARKMTVYYCPLQAGGTLD
ncbi:hypothetical protein L9F63_021662 [Diploptera punctata]|uniref:Carbonic anhydrase n=1 Tax=Diploptera punctata TaxID=6984 RepID=A0AAD8EBT1_DIPPU|nr:hypothetical protein L9F63_021662 [Diploptera punctata]